MESPVRFFEWLEQEEAANNEYQEGLLASFFHGRISEALKAFFSDDRRESFPHYLSTVWPVAAQVKNEAGTFPFPEKVGRVKLGPDFGGWTLELAPASQGTFAYCGAGKVSIPYDASVLRQAQEFGDRVVQQMLDRIEDQLVHECSHICTSKPGEDAQVKGKPYWERFAKGSVEYAEAQIKYYTDPGEVRAHARQYANMYIKRYGQNFEQRTVEKMAWELKDHKLWRFISRLRDRNVQKQFPNLKDRMLQAYDNFMKQMDYFVTQGRVTLS